MTILGILLTTLTWVKVKFDLELTGTELEHVAETLLMLAGLTIAYIGRTRIGDLWLLKNPDKEKP